MRTILSVPKRRRIIAQEVLICPDENMPGDQTEVCWDVWLLARWWRLRFIAEHEGDDNVFVMKCGA